MIEICLKYDNMHIFGIINAFNCINNHVVNVKIACYQYTRMWVTCVHAICAYAHVRERLINGLEHPLRI